MKADSYNIFQIKGDILYFGDGSGANDGSTPAKRPVALMEGAPWKKDE